MDALAAHRRALGVGPGADSSSLKAAFRKASVRAHPDQGGSDEKFQRVQEAYEALTKHAHEERWGTSSSSYGAGVAAAQPLLLKN